MEAPPTEDRVTGRSLAKASRRAALLDAAAQLFADRGYNGVSIEDLGAAAGVSGPAVYRHFTGKPSVLSALLTGVSEDLLVGGRSVAADASSPEDALRALIRFQVEFALNNADVIRVQDRDLASLPHDDERTVRSLQRSYVQVWVDQLADHLPDADRSLLRRKVHAVFGLINSTPHTAHGTGSGRELAQLRDLLQDMAWAALTV
ncbi:TetR/AcrR family transcriptional regulator [Arthrobacter sp. B1805]|uniref:TetR/AcrR family transcriptional regulator n=1 Tax=Arthrobacter sp. B1805 TaxID=2058892 RepID=UPI000CE40E8A|nr:TetR/AcrR family transcriptional regulator [Arthrobacter sp. B1805]